MKARYRLPGFGFAIILAVATVASGAEPPCHRHAVLEAWLAARAEAWDSRLAGIPGYERPGPLSVCQVTGGGPRSDGGRIYLPPIRGNEELLCLAHEYVHLAFRHHPATRNEDFVERTARALMSGEELQ
jgi:uncharacterized protein YfaQ (DUF2300 family)